MRKPDFFIAGAPKCGTSSMHTYLQQHPDIFMSKIKEPSFFGTDLHHTKPLIRTLEEYLSLFSNIQDEKRVGESSTSYFYSEYAASEIKKFNPLASIIIMLRNPIDMLYSLHNQQIYENNEDIIDFEGALNAEEKRKKGLDLREGVSTREILFYRELAKLTPKVQRYLEVFGCEKVHIIIYDDLKRDVAKVYRETLQFLDVKPDFQPDFRIINPSKQIRSKALHNFLVNPPQFARKIVNAVMPRPILQRVFAGVRNLNTQYTPRQPMNAALRRRLQVEFAPDVERLSVLLGRDLTHWCTRDAVLRHS